MVDIKQIPEVTKMKYSDIEGNIIDIIGTSLPFIFIILILAKKYKGMKTHAKIVRKKAFKRNFFRRRRKRY